MKLLARWFLTALALLSIPYLIAGITIRDFYTALIAALILGLVNALIKPIIMILTLPFNVITLGLFTLVINALMFWFASSIVKGFTVAGFWPAFWGSILMWVINWFINGLLHRKRE
ncbi:MAG: hypothetical protein A3I29_01530 [Candidatus Magasanikbacteria bacterium RIFCSPLOWO2_02_FULL_44_11]|uniref:Phage holin family protein n=2 Tax=Candidatus Magasanikiibacteriota TaxID=1752731 RepID=A0A1F6NA13_9BACT|nr:MAG: hypothetical protein A3D53_00100 [Candidatus Magasanikbacteria bacterium RIFCSPHIGHO2_02_FULL_45_10]OGH80762.1 MAG: hypothetical protein A3I29_01530 [Candidatus Magasanikbacteria bacterium RIFCSPLOWO2_02_FULL_44_11]